MNWRSLILLAFSVISMASCQEKETEDPRPNILFLLADDQRYNTINALGNDHILTPNLDRLVEQGLIFEQAYIMGSTSGAVCAPSRAMLMTGKTLYHLNKEGEWNYHIEAADTTMPELLRMKGWKTAGIGKQHNGKPVFARGFSTGGHLMFGGMSDHYDIPVFDFFPDSIYAEDRGYQAVDKHSTDLYTDDAIRFLEQYDGDRPFFLYVSFQAPHDPRDMPGSFLELYQDKDIPLPPNFLPRHPFDNGELVIRDEMLADFPRTPDEILGHIRDYYAMITHLDDGVGRILASLEKNGLADRTLIIFTADNGLAVGQHGLMGKQNLYEHSIRVPMILAGPGIPAGQQTSALCYISDLYPTLADMLSLDLPQQVEGKSFAHLLANPAGEHRPFLVFGYKQYQRAVRKGPWKLIEYVVNGDRHTQLFRLDKDPWETRNIVSFPGNNQTRLELLDLLKQESQAIDDGGGFWSQLE